MKEEVSVLIKGQDNCRYSMLKVHALAWEDHPRLAGRFIGGGASDEHSNRQGYILIFMRVKVILYLQERRLSILL